LEELVADFELNTEFFLVLGLFFTITLIITIVIVFFMTKVETLSAFLLQAKEMDEEKTTRILALERALKEEKTVVLRLEKELVRLREAQAKIEILSEHIDHLKNDLALQVREHRLFSLHQEKRYAKLKEHYDLLVKENGQLKRRLGELTVAPLGLVNT